MSSLGGFIWNNGDQLRGIYTPAQYGTARLPLVLRRMECVLSDQREEIDETAAKTPNDVIPATKLRKQFGLHFWNRTDYTLKSLLRDSGILGENLIDYTADFSANLLEKRPPIPGTIRRIAPSTRSRARGQRRGSSSCRTNQTWESGFDRELRKHLAADGRLYSPNHVRYDVARTLHPADLFNEKGRWRRRCWSCWASRSTWNCMVGMRRPMAAGDRSGCCHRTGGQLRGDRVSYYQIGNS